MVTPLGMGSIAGQAWTQIKYHANLKPQNTYLAKHTVNQFVLLDLQVLITPHLFVLVMIDDRY